MGKVKPQLFSFSFPLCNFLAKTFKLNPKKQILELKSPIYHVKFLTKEQEDGKVDSIWLGQHVRYMKKP